MVVFLPLGLLQGVVGQFFAALATTLTVAVLVSLGLALTIIPLLAERFVTAHEVEAAQTGPLARVQRALDALPPSYERALAAVLHHPRRIAAADTSKLGISLPRCKIAGRARHQATPSCFAIAFIALASSTSRAVTPPASWVARTTSTVL